MDLPTSTRIRDVIPARDGNLVLVTGEGLQYWNKASRTLSTSLPTQQTLHLSTRRAGHHRLDATAQRPSKEPIYREGQPFGEKAPVYELWTVDLATGQAERVKQYWNVKAMLAGPAGVFGLSHKGRLRRLVHTNFKDLGPSEAFTRILAVGRKILWLIGWDGRLRIVRSKTGRVLHVVDVKASDLGAFDLDTRTGDLAFVQDGRWLRVRAGTGAIEAMAPARGAEASEEATR